MPDKQATPPPELTASKDPSEQANADEVHPKTTRPWLGQMFKPSSSILRTKEALKFVQLITPGNTVNGVLMLFDVAPGTNVVNIQLHDSPVSSGVNVKLA